MSSAVPRRSLSDDLTGSLLAMINDHGLQTGDQLESLRSMSDRFGVAVPTLREAVRKLEATGMVELRHGSGIYVGKNIGRWVLTNPAAPAPSREQLIKLLEARSVIEPPVAALAAVMRTDESLEVMRADLDLAQTCIDSGDWPRLSDLNMAFHRAVAAASGNPMLAEVVDSITSVNAREQLEILRIHGDRQADHDEHVAILAAIADSDPKKAEQLTRSHLTDVLDVVRTKTRPTKIKSAQTQRRKQ